MSSVIKSGQSTRAVNQVAFNLEDITQHASSYLEQVRIQAAKIVVEAQKQADLIKKRAQEDGQQSARQVAEKVLDEKVGKKMESLLPALRQVITDLADAKHSWLRQWESTAVKLAAGMAKKIIRSELQRQPELPVKLVREALELSAGGSHVRILLNPGDFETLGNQIKNLTQEFKKLGQAEIVPDQAIQSGGCRIIAQQGEIDQQIETQLDRIVSELTSSNED